MNAITSQLTVAEVLAQWPTTAVIFQKYKTDCVGCPIAPFDTLEDVANIYGFDLPTFLAELNATLIPPAPANDPPTTA